MVGVAGFEPTNGGIKTRCLTTWRHPNGVQEPCRARTTKVRHRAGSSRATAWAAAPPASSIDGATTAAKTIAASLSPLGVSSSSATTTTGTATIFKPAVAGGRVDFDTVRQQLLYEVGDPTAYLTPDVSGRVAELLKTHLEDIRGLIEDAQDKRADLQGSDAPEREPEPEPESDAEENPSPEPEPEPTEAPAEEQTATEPEQPAPDQTPVEQAAVEPAVDEPEALSVSQPTPEDPAQPEGQVRSTDQELGTAQ